MDVEGSDPNMKSLRSKDKVINTVPNETTLKMMQLGF